jgi:peptide/nickel transport system permease protein
MTGYLARRIIQMVIVVFFSAAASYALLNFAPGGPMAGLRQMSQNSRFRLTEEDVARIRAYFELDLYLPIRFSRWLVGQPKGRIIMGNYELFALYPIGCRKPIERTVKNAKGEYEVEQTGCAEYVYLKNLEGRRSSRGVLFGDFGLSWRLNRDRPVTDLILGRLPQTMLLMGISILIALGLGVPLGIYSAIRQYSKFDYVVTSMAFLGTSMPTFFFGLLLIMCFAIIPKNFGLPNLPAGLSESVRDYTIPYIGDITAGSMLDRTLHLILPVTVLAMVSVAGYSRYVRASMLDVLRQDYVRTARAKGLVEKVVIVKHALRNALIPFVTIAVFALPAMFAGAILTESIFSWPGMGRLFVLALGEYDYPVAMALLLIEAVLIVVATLLQDIIYTIVDPRIRFS